MDAEPIESAKDDPRLHRADASANRGEWRGETGAEFEGIEALPPWAGANGAVLQGSTLAATASVPPGFHALEDSLPRLARRLWAWMGARIGARVEGRRLIDALKAQLAAAAAWTGKGIDLSRRHHAARGSSMRIGKATRARWR